MGMLAGCGEKDPKSAGGDNDSGNQGGDTVERIADELKAKMLTFAEAARSAQDAPSAREAAATLKELGGEMKGIAERLAKLEVPSDEVRRKLGQDLQETEAEIERRMGDAEAVWEKLDPAANKLLEEGLGAFGMKMQEAMVVFEEYFETEVLEE